jgi:hypothetical protein
MELLLAALEEEMLPHRVMELLVAALAEVVHRHRVMQLLLEALEEAILLRPVTELRVEDLIELLHPHQATELPVVDSEVAVMVLPSVIRPRLHLRQVMELLMGELVVVLLHLATELQTADLELE